MSSTTKKIAIADYGAGNLVSVKKAIDHLGFACSITADPLEFARAEKIILPGVGHFSATSALTHTGLRAAISESISRSVPFLGICVGMQWMFAASDESAETPGLALFSGVCTRFPSNIKCPHVGWNQLDIKPNSILFCDLPPNPYVYFTHSYFAPINESTSATCNYAGDFSAAVERDHIFGVQFHPEKSGETGLALLRNFCAL